MRHVGTCYKAANFLQVGNTLGYARWNGAFVHHGYKKTCWLYPLHKNAATILASDFDHPLLSKDKEVEMVDLMLPASQADHADDIVTDHVV